MLLTSCHTAQRWSERQAYEESGTNKTDNGQLEGNACNRRAVNWSKVDIIIEEYRNYQSFCSYVDILVNAATA
jgi:hypothetical protein